MMEMVGKMKRRSDSPWARASLPSTTVRPCSLAMQAAASNIRRHIIENDYLEAIIQLPNNLFYNTGITTYVWVLSNNKADKRKGKVQLIDASNLYQKLRKNLGEKNCEFTDEHIHQITQLYLEMPNEGISKVFNNRDFGYYKVTVERPCDWPRSSAPSASPPCASRRACRTSWNGCTASTATRFTPPEGTPKPSKPTLSAKRSLFAQEPQRTAVRGHVARAARHHAGCTATGRRKSAATSTSTALRASSMKPQALGLKLATPAASKSSTPSAGVTNGPRRLSRRSTSSMQPS
jgi:hypothetical protein